MRVEPVETIEAPQAAPDAAVGTRVWVALLVILAAAAVVRVCGLSSNSFWIDEFYSLEISAGNCFANMFLPRGVMMDRPPHPTRLSEANGSVWHLWSTLDNDPHPPLYYMLLRGWRSAFGSSDGEVRSLSLVASLVGIVLLFDVGRWLIGPAGALWACGIVAVSHPQIWFAQEARSYALLTAALLGACSAVVRIERLGFTTARAAALAACLVGTMLTHYFGVAGCMAVGLYAAVRLPGRVRVRTMLVMAGAAGVYAVVWGPFLWKQMHGQAYHQTLWLADGGGAGFVGRWADRVLRAPYRVLFRTTEDDGIWKVFAVVLSMPLLIPARRRALLLPALCAIGVIVLPAALDLARGTKLLHFERYFVAAGPFVCLLVAGLPAVGRFRWMPHVLPAAAVLYCAVSLPWVYAPHNQDWRSLGQAVGRSVGRGDVIVYHTPAFGDWYAGALYLDVDHYAGNTGARVVMLDGAPSAAVMEGLRAAPNVWLVTDATGFDVPSVLPGFAPGPSEFAWGVGYVVRLVPSTGAR